MQNPVTILYLPRHAAIAFSPLVVHSRRYKALLARFSVTDGVWKTRNVSWADFLSGLSRISDILGATAPHQDQSLRACLLRTVGFAFLL